MNPSSVRRMILSHNHIVLDFSIGFSKVLVRRTLIAILGRGIVYKSRSP